MRAGFTLLLILVVFYGCDQQAPPRDWGMRFSREYLEKRNVCESRPDPVLPSTFDYGRSLHDSVRPISWESQHRFLGDTCYETAIGPAYYQDVTPNRPAYYSVEVEARKTETYGEGKKRESHVVLYRRDFEIDELPKAFDKESIDSVVHYDEERRVVRFDIGDDSYEYWLPRP